MKKSFLSMLVAVFISLPLFSGSDATAKVYVDVDSPNFRLFPIATCDFNLAYANTAYKSSDLGIALADEIKIYLKMTGFFNLLNKKSFLDDKRIDPVVFTNWVIIGADYLVKGTVKQGEKEIINECRLYDVVKGELLFNKKYTVGPNDLNTLAKNIASDILFTLTGEEGDFNTKIAFVAKKGNIADIYTVNYDGSDWRTITGHRSIIIAPHWSPDGQKLLLTLSKDGNEELYVLEVQNMRFKRLTSNYSIDVSPSWSPRGGRIAFEGLINRRFQVFTIDEEGNNLMQLTFDAADNEAPSWSPSGRQIAYSSRTGSKSKICIMNANGMNVRVLREGGGPVMMPMWSPRLK